MMACGWYYLESYQKFTHREYIDWHKNITLILYNVGFSHTHAIHNNHIIVVNV